MIETLLAAACGGAALTYAGLPGGWLAGAIIAVSAMALSGRPVGVPSWLARVTYVVMGTSLGATVTPATIAGMATWPLSLVMLSIGMFVLTAIVTLYLTIIHKWDSNSAVLASFPGGLATVLVLAIENKADVRSVAVVQTVRVAGLAVLLPGTLAALGFVGAPASRAAVACHSPATWCRSGS
ncbi:MAG: AbrB family transcriptional regulator [Rhizobiales bacterium]|nr:AbrB family transcriptional regulator [Hyphomicrobiales bacterium]